MRNFLYITVLVFFITPLLYAQSPDSDDYQSYNQIVDDLHSKLSIKDESTQAKLLSSSYSLAAGLQSQFLSINKDSTQMFGAGVELGVYNFLLAPLKMGLDFVSGTEVKSTLAHAKTDHSIFRYNLIDVKLGLAAGAGFYKARNDRFTSFFLAPSLAGYYQLNKGFDINFSITYAFHASNEIASHLSPAVNLVSYF